MDKIKEFIKRRGKNELLANISLILGIVVVINAMFVMYNSVKIMSLYISRFINGDVNFIWLLLTPITLSVPIFFKLLYVFIAAEGFTQEYRRIKYGNLKVLSIVLLLINIFGLIANFNNVDLILITLFGLYTLVLIKGGR